VAVTAVGVNRKLPPTMASMPRKVGLRDHANSPSILRAVRSRSMPIRQEASIWRSATTRVPPDDDQDESGPSGTRTHRPPDPAGDDVGALPQRPEHQEREQDRAAHPVDPPDEVMGGVG
jgi:hypothetical protein